MIKTVLEGLTILPSPPTMQGTPIAPIVPLENGLTLDDRMLESPTLLFGDVGSGKSILLDQMMRPILDHARANQETVIIFCAKKHFLNYRREGDIVISVDTQAPEACWSIFRELAAGKNAELIARDITKSLTESQESKLTPFFVNAATDILTNAILCMYDESLKTGDTYGNWHLCDFLKNTTIGDGGEFSWNELARLRPQYFGHIPEYLGDNLGQGYGIISEILTLLHSAFWGSFCSKNGRFSAIETLKTGKVVFLYYDYANSSQASMKIFATILTLLLKHAVDEHNHRRTWFLLDEASLLPKTCLVDALSFGRSSGCRVIMALQSAQLMTRHYKENEAKTALGLFPNLLAMRTQDRFTRSLFADRYGECLCSYSYNTMQRVVQHVEHRPVVADYDFARLRQKGDALFSIPALSESPFFYHGYRKELDTNA